MSLSPAQRHSQRVAMQQQLARLESVNTADSLHMQVREIEADVLRLRSLELTADRVEMKRTELLPKWMPTVTSYLELGKVYANPVLAYCVIWLFDVGDPRLLMALLEVWLAADEEKRELFGLVGITNADPDWDIELIDEETAIVAVTVPMAEALIIVPDEAGNIPYQGGRYRLANAEIWTALSALVYAPGGDVPGVAE